MKAVFVSYGQAYNEEIIDILAELGQRGFTRWEETHGRGGVDGRPHMGSHAWPQLNHSLLTFIKDENVQPLLDALKKKDQESPELGLRAFVWNVETFY